MAGSVGNRVGRRAGIRSPCQVGTLRPDISIECTRITNRTYHQMHARNRFLYRNRLLGHPLGPDSDSLALGLRWWPSALQSITLAAATWRHGEGSIHGPWTEHWTETDDIYKEPFPTGTVERSTGMSVELRGYVPGSSYLSRHIYVELEGGYHEATNAGHMDGRDDSHAWLRASLSWLGAFETGIGE